MELDPKYVDVIVQRWQDYTGNKAVLDSEEHTFDDLRTQRQVRPENTTEFVPEGSRRNGIQRAALDARD
jgi:hypothetical protein